MSTLCRTCGQDVEHGKSLFEKEGSEVLYNIFKLTGIWLSDKPGLPSRICLSCLLDLNEAIAFRERCIKTNNSWINKQNSQEDSPTLVEKDISQEDLRVDVAPISIVQQQKIAEEERSPAKRSRKRNESSLKTQDDSNYPLGEPTADLMDPLRCADIEVKNEPLPSDEESIRTKNVRYGNEEDIKTVTIVTRKKRGRPKVDGKTEAEKHALRRKWAAEKRAQAKDQKRYFCDQCGKTFSERGNFNVHLTRHKGTKEFQCKECDRKEFTQHLLNLHVRIKHRGELPYVCKYCGQRFDNCLKRLFHERKHEENPDHRPYACPICNKGFKKKESLKTHGVVHTGEQPFHCNLCQAHFNRRNSLRTHYKSKQHRTKMAEQGKKING
ncbi:transcription factor Ouib [Drosophila eugracilis]|uniref:transcription factor Ouib n=1 Tax=Drosophila eugracilis TaxID=29029 RepID=UPI0007E6990E|nr:transcription factor Ouib [Drosophila eugracilis]